MKQLLLSFLALFLFASVQGQTCTPDTSYTNPGIYPENGSTGGFINVEMADAFVGMMYDEVVHLKIPSDTIIDTMGLQIPAIIDSLFIIDFVNLPASMSYQCNTINCRYEGDENGCIRFVGTPTANEVGTYNIGLQSYGFVNAGILGTLADTLIFPMSIEIKPAQGIDEYISNGSIQFSPNPFNETANLQFNAIRTTPYRVRLVDLTGRTVQEINGKTHVGSNNVTINRNDLPGGMYFYSLEIDEYRHTGRFIINR